MKVIEWPTELPSAVVIALLEVGRAHAHAVLVQLRDEDGTAAEAAFERAVAVLANTIAIHEAAQLRAVH